MGLPESNGEAVSPRDGTTRQSQTPSRNLAAHTTDAIGRSGRHRLHRECISWSVGSDTGARHTYVPRAVRRRVSGWCGLLVDDFSAHVASRRCVGAGPHGFPGFFFFFCAGVWCQGFATRASRLCRRQRVLRSSAHQFAMDSRECDIEPLNS